MAELIDLPSFTDERGGLTVLEKCVPFHFKRAFWITDPNGTRGGHGHIKTHMVLIAVHGSCEVHVKNQRGASYALNSPDKALWLSPEDWHEMTDFAPSTVLLVLASEYYDPEDYVLEPSEREHAD